MRDAVIVGAVRTPVGRRNGGLSGVHPVDLSAHVLRSLAERTGFEPELVGDVIWGCVSQVGEQSWNVARNALQAMPEGGTLRAELRRSAGGRVRITFTDSGVGMSPEQVEHLFEPFSSRTGGTGLGLSIVYQIIRDHGGTINVRSREGQGTTISVELPGEKQ